MTDFSDPAFYLVVLQVPVHPARSALHLARNVWNHPERHSVCSHEYGFELLLSRHVFEELGYPSPTNVAPEIKTETLDEAFPVTDLLCCKARYS